MQFTAKKNGRGKKGKCSSYKTTPNGGGQQQRESRSTVGAETPRKLKKRIEERRKDRHEFQECAQKSEGNRGVDGPTGETSPKGGINAVQDRRRRIGGGIKPRKRGGKNQAENSKSVQDAGGTATFQRSQKARAKKKKLDKCYKSRREKKKKTQGGSRNNQKKKRGIERNGVDLCVSRRVSPRGRKKTKRPDCAIHRNQEGHIAQGKGGG